MDNFRNSSRDLQDLQYLPDLFRFFHIVCHFSNSKYCFFYHFEQTLRKHEKKDKHMIKHEKT